MADLAVRVRDLHKQYPGRDGPVHAVNGIDLEIGVGECYGILGPNGAGKTTTIEILEGLNTPTSGDVEVLGLRWETDEKQLRARIGVTLQDTRFPDHATVRELVGLFRSFYERGANVDEILASVSLESRANALNETLSGGQSRRLAVALALVGEPDLIFFDEPTTGLDPQSRRQLWDVIRNLQERGRTTILTTHYMDEAERLCDRIAIVDQGKMIALGTPAELIARIGGEHVVEFSVGGSGPAPDAARFADLPAVRSSRIDNEGYALTVSEPHLAIPALLERLAQENRPLARLTTRQASLEDVFVVLTGRHLREEEPDPAGEAKPKRSRRKSRAS